MSPATQNSTLSAFAKKAWKQPQQLWLRKAFFQIHLWAGLLLALYMITISISGSILVYKDELTPRPRAGHAPFDARNCTPLRLIAAIAAAARLHPELEASVASCPTEANPFYAITLRPHASSGPASQSRTVYLHPDTGAVIGQVDAGAGWLAFVERFHEDLLLKRNGRLWNGAGAAVLLVLVATGAVIWWPGQKNWRRGFKVNPQLSWKRINFDLHSAAGIWTLLFTFTWALTGIYFAWPAPFDRAISSISPIVTARYPEEEMGRILARPTTGSAGKLDLLAVLTSTETTSDDTRLEGVFFGSGAAPVLTVYRAQGRIGDYTRTDFLYFDQTTGKRLYTWRRGRNQTLGDWLTWIIVPLHFGTSFGPLGKFLWCVLGLVLPLLVVTGTIMYWNRWLSKKIKLANKTRNSALQ